MRAHPCKQCVRGTLALLLAAVPWLPCVHFFFKKSPETFHCVAGISPKARQLAARHLQLWTDPTLRRRELEKMRASNAEWDFMGRSFLVWSLANMGLRDPASKQTYLQTMDQIIDETMRLEKSEGMYFFLMPYARASHYVVEPAHSLFLDGEIALMLASRRSLEEKSAYKTLLNERVNAIADRLRRSPRLLLESYPDECWMFDHVVALAAVRMADTLDATDHTALVHDWLAMAKQRLIH